MYFTLSGTSMAAPMVAGAAALMIQKDSTLTPDLVKARLMKSAFKNFPLHTTVEDALGNVYNEEGDIFTYGAGDLDAAAALMNTDKGSGSALSPTAVYNSKNKTVDPGADHGQRDLQVGPVGHQRALGRERGVGQQRVCRWHLGAVGQFRPLGLYYFDRQRR